MACVLLVLVCVPIFVEIDLKHTDIPKIFQKFMIFQFDSNNFTTYRMSHDLVSLGICTKILRNAENERNSNSDEKDFPCTFIIDKKNQFFNFKTLLLRFKKLVCEATQLIQHTVVITHHRNKWYLNCHLRFICQNSHLD